VTRTHLTKTDYNENIDLWSDMVEKQTDERFILTGAILCVGEELGEMEAAMFHGELTEASDAIGDTYVASRTTRKVILRDYPTIDVDDLPAGQQYPISNRSTFVGQLNGEICRFARKGLKDAGQAQELYDVLLRIEDFVQRLAVDHDLEFTTDCIEPVLDILDKRLTQGYKMRNGSAIKLADRVVAP
jgi:hypothetical protein